MVGEQEQNHIDDTYVASWAPIYWALLQGLAWRWIPLDHGSYNRPWLLIYSFQKGYINLLIDCSAY